MTFVENQPPEGQDPQTQEEEDYLQGLSPAARSYLEGLPEDQRPIVAPHAKNWDKDFQGHVQRVNEQIKPYRDLGDVQQLTQLKQFGDWFNRDPQGFVKALVENGIVDTKDLQLPEKPPIPEEIAPVLDEFKQLKQMFGPMAKYIQDQQAKEQENQQTQVLNSWLEEAKKHTKHYDEAGVTSLLASGMNPQQAGQAWERVVQNAINARTKVNPAPTVQNSGGYVLPQGKQGRDMSKSDITAFVADVLQKNKDAGQS